MAKNNNYGIIVIGLGILVLLYASGVSAPSGLTDLKDKVQDQFRSMDRSNVYDDWAQVTGNVDENGVSLSPEEIGIDVYDVYGHVTFNVLGNFVTSIDFEMKEGSNPVAAANILGIDTIVHRMRLYVGEWEPEELSGAARNYELDAVSGKEWYCKKGLGLTEFSATCDFKYKEIPKGRYTLLVESEYYNGDVQIKSGDFPIENPTGDVPVSVKGTGEAMVIVFDVPGDL